MVSVRVSCGPLWLKAKTAMDMSPRRKHGHIPDNTICKEMEALFSSQASLGGQWFSGWRTRLTMGVC
jgi:hypothetical protein